MIKRNQNDSGAGDQFLSTISGAIWPTCTRYTIISLFLCREYFFFFFFFLWRNGRIWNAALFPSFLPEKLSGISFSRTSYETRILFSNWCNCFLEDAGLSSGSCFLFYHSGNVKGATLVSSFSPHSDLCDLKLNIRSWSWWVLDFEDKRWSILFSNLSYLQGYLRSFFLFSFLEGRNHRFKYIIFVNRNWFLKRVYIEYIVTFFFY